MRAGSHPGSLAGGFETIVRTLFDKVAAFYGERLLSFVVYGSVGRRAPRPDSDVDLLLVIEPLPRGRVRRADEFRAVERLMAPELKLARGGGIQTRFSPVFKTPAEVGMGSPLFLDMVQDAWVLYDRDGFFGRRLDALRDRLARLGARRIWKGNAWYWDLKPDYKWGDVFEI
jgi:predicted nucleotidyltransferase